MTPTPTLLFILGAVIAVGEWIDRSIPLPVIAALVVWALFVNPCHRHG